jgi:hypothetical protein
LGFPVLADFGFLWGLSMRLSPFPWSGLFRLVVIEAVAGNDPISRIAVRENVSRKFLYQQKQKAKTVLDQAFFTYDKASDVFFYIPVSRSKNAKTSPPGGGSIRLEWMAALNRNSQRSV